VALVGPTAGGKSAVAMAAAAALGDVEIVSVDSMQVFRGMDIGTDKPSAADRALVHHHCLDLVEPCCDFTVADFRNAHDHAIGAIGAAQGSALLVGGTGLYHRVVIDDFDLPGEWPDVRRELLGRPPAQLHARLTELDPVAAAKIEPTNERRLVRALEVCLGSGRPFSSFGPGIDAYPPTPVIQIGLRRPRPVIAELIERRVHRMIEQGLVGEVRSLLPRGFSRTAGQALGYKEIVDHLEGRTSEADAVATIIRRTRRFATRQERWFQRDPRVRWIDVDDDPVAEALPAVLAAFDSLA
jgi:tRNA dimethylallyltransferase